MIYSKLIKLIEDNADELTERMYKDLTSREETKSYAKMNKDIVCERIYEVYSRLDTWLSKDKHKSGEIERLYTEVGRRRFREGVPLHEVVMAFMLKKRHIWLYVLEKHFIDSSYELYQALEMNNKVVLFFDRVIFFVTKGYEDELRKVADSKDKGVLSKLLKKKD